MNLELMSVLVGALSSIVSAITFYVAKKAAKSTTSENTFLVKNSDGETREVTIGNKQTHRDISKAITANIEYEKLIELTLRNVRASGVKVSKNSKHDLGYDFLLTTPNAKYLIEAKANKKPVDRRVIQRILKAANQQNSTAVILSKSGFDKSAIEWLSQQKDSTKVKLHTAKSAVDVKDFIKTII
ncbi:restriction endonuclease [Vibrio alginolyticus]|uniref:restriction endonuclease n=1 Tax=Vibrio alginolyticus TaxID=663 RepID=UPI003D7E55AB